MVLTLLYTESTDLSTPFSAVFTYRQRGRSMSAPNAQIRPAIRSSMESDPPARVSPAHGKTVQARGASVEDCPAPPLRKRCAFIHKNVFSPLTFHLRRVTIT